jgi:lysophospholipase L1-like esterase
MQANPPSAHNCRVPVTIVALGDSTTAGTPGFLSPLEAPPAGRGDETSQYAYWLMRDRPGWQVLNCGVNGERSDQILARFDRDALAARPAVVVIIAGVNDIYQGRDAASVKANLLSMYARARAANVAVVAGTILPYDTATHEQNSRMAEVNAWVAVQAREMGLGFADTCRAVSAPESPHRLASSPDGLHPGPEGYRRMAEVIGPEIARRIEALSR